MHAGPVGAAVALQGGKRQCQRTQQPQVGVRSRVEDAEDAHEAAIVRAALERFRYNQRATAKGLGLTYDQLRHCMKKHGLSAG